MDQIYGGAIKGGGFGYVIKEVRYAHKEKKEKGTHNKGLLC